MLIALLCVFLLGAEGKHLWDGSRPHWRSTEVFTEIYLDPAERHVTGSRFSSWAQRGEEGSDCNCQGICGHGRGGDDHKIFANNKMSGATGGKKNKSDRIAYCYAHVCNAGFTSICDQGKELDINKASYHRNHRACTCARAAGIWKHLEGDYKNNKRTITRTNFAEYAKSVTNTATVGIESKVDVSAKIYGIGASVSTSLSAQLAEAIENSWKEGLSSTKTIEIQCSGENTGTDTAWQYVIYMYDVLCAEGNGDKRFVVEKEGGCAITAFLPSDGITCTTSKDEPPCCGPGSNPASPNDRKFCEDDFESWTGQCDGFKNRVRSTSVVDGRINCRFEDCPDLEDPSLQGYLSTCGYTCGNNAYANTFVPSQVFGASNMLQCDSLGWMTTFFRNHYCQANKQGKHRLALISRDCARIVYSRSDYDFDDAYKRAEKYARNKWPSEDTRDLVPIYYNNWIGTCDGILNIEEAQGSEAAERPNLTSAEGQLLKGAESKSCVEGQDCKAESGFDFQALDSDVECKCDPDCSKWGDCCDDCAEAISMKNDVEGLDASEWFYLRAWRTKMSHEEYERVRGVWGKKHL